MKKVIKSNINNYVEEQSRIFFDKSEEIREICAAMDRMGASKSQAAGDVLDAANDYLDRTISRLQKIWEM